MIFFRQSADLQETKGSRNESSGENKLYKHLIVAQEEIEQDSEPVMAHDSLIFPEEYEDNLQLSTFQTALGQL